MPACVCISACTQVLRQSLRLYLLCNNFGQVTVVQLHQSITFLKLILNKLCSDPVPAGAPAQTLKQVADHAYSMFLFFLLS